MIKQTIDPSLAAQTNKEGRKMKIIQLSLGIIAALLVFACMNSSNESETSVSDFTVHSALGNDTFHLADAKGKYVALHFLLKTECPICLSHTQEYAKLDREQEDVIHIFLKPDTEEEIQAWASKMEMGIPQPEIYRDPNAQLAKQFNIPYGYEFHGQTVHYPALVLLDKDGEEIYRFVGTNNRERYPVADFLSKLENLEKADH
jgi:peroxiredoxin Q/BCP